MHTDKRGNISGQECHAKTAEMKLKYKSLRTEIQKIWNIEL
jgi:hypothetical protein